MSLPRWKGTVVLRRDNGIVYANPSAAPQRTLIFGELKPVPSVSEWVRDPSTRPYCLSADKFSFEPRLAVHQEEFNYFLHVAAQLIETLSLAMSARKTPARSLHKVKYPDIFPRRI